MAGRIDLGALRQLLLGDELRWRSGRVWATSAETVSQNLAVTNENDSTVSILLVDGTGNFTLRFVSGDRAPAPLGRGRRLHGDVKLDLWRSPTPGDMRFQCTRRKPNPNPSARPCSNSSRDRTFFAPMYH